ncbi:MAG: hypothetical protein JO093_11520 [Acidobacteria bacterium]|nr:hypothetical protein [Acidobacteriota bacterium]MBV9071152.1 hypothetical protein [Acidobacteriota bacterium]MBV9186246.1 hypothetical protein [Acidobacteriota bacterium]
MANAKVLMLGSMLFAASALAVETVRINPAINPPAGTTIHGSAELEVSGTSVVRGVDGKELSTKRISQMDREEYVDTTISRDAVTTKSKRIYGRVLHGDETGSEFTPMNGRTLNFVIKGKSIEVTSGDGKPLLEDERVGLTELVQRSLRVEANNLCIASFPLAVGASWNIPAAQLADCYDSLGHAVKTIPGRATLRALEPRNGHRVAVIEVSFVRSVDRIGALVFDVPADAAVTSTIEVTVDIPARWSRVTTTTLSGVTHPKGPDAPSLTTALRATETLTSAP